jgi:hypothetical protein
MNKLYVGREKTVELPKGGCLLIDDEIRDVKEWRRPRIFDPLKHSFNPLKDIDYRKACDLVAVFEAVFPAGAGTLTKEGVPDVLLEALLAGPERLDTLLEDKSADPSYVSAQRMVRRLMRSPVLKRVFCNPTNFTFNRNSVNMARINRAELGDFDALVLGLFLMAQFEGQIVCPDFGFYGRDLHIASIRGQRLIAGVNFLDELPPKLLQSALLIKDKEPKGATVDDAETVALYAGLIRGTNAYNDFVERATSGDE